MKPSAKSGGLLVCLFLYIPVVWGALLLAQSLGGGLPEIVAKLTDALRHPWAVRWTDKSLLTILACTGAYVMALALHSA